MLPSFLKRPPTMPGQMPSPTGMAPRPPMPAPGGGNVRLVDDSGMRPTSLPPQGPNPAAMPAWMRGLLPQQAQGNANPNAAFAGLAMPGSFNPPQRPAPQAPDPFQMQPGGGSQLGSQLGGGRSGGFFGHGMFGRRVSV